MRSPLSWFMCIALGALQVSCADASAQPGPPGRPGAPAYGSASPDAGTAELPPSLGAVSGIPNFDAKPPPRDRSEPPSREDWAKAPLADDVRVTDPGCQAKRIREYYRLSCDMGQAIGLVAGSREGIEFGCPKETRDTDFCEEAWVVFPMRMGDRRVFQFFRWAKWGPTPNSVATAQWLEGDPAPMVTLQGIRWGF